MKSYAQTLQPIVTYGQELIVVEQRRNLQPMVTPNDEKKRFAARLNAALDSIGAPGKGAGRQEFVRRLFGVSQQAAGKWLTGESMPDTKRIPIMARELRVRGEWLLTGIGSMDAQAGAAGEMPENQVVGFQVDNDEKALILKLRHLPIKEKKAIMELLKAMESSKRLQGEDTQTG